MEFLQILFVAPFIEIADSPVFFAEVVINGMLTGIFYSLVALGYVLIFKASGVFNFAQGAMVLFAPLTLAELMETGVPFLIAFVLTVLVMIALAFLIEWAMLRRLVNQDGMILFMATIGLSFILEGSGQLIWVSDVKNLDVGLPDSSFEVWGVAGVIALVAGMVWGAKSGVQFSLSLIALKALPVLILGGFTSIPGAIIGGLIIGVGEKVAEIYWGRCSAVPSKDGSPTC